SYGSTGATDRAFGTLRVGTFSSTIGAPFSNTTGGTIDTLAISFIGEEWRRGAASAVRDRLDFEYSTNATSLTTGTWTPVDALDFNSPLITTAVGAKNGNAAANRTAVSFAITGLSIPSGATFWIRWTDFDRGGAGVADDGLAIDDFTLTPSGPTFATTVSVWNWATTSWVSIAGPTPVGGTDVTVADNVA